MTDKEKPAVFGDARFQKVHHDPRFARVSKKKTRLQIDQRFAAVLKDDKFQSVQGKYDKYGRHIDKKSNELKKFYRLDDEVDEEELEEQGDAINTGTGATKSAKAKPMGSVPSAGVDDSSSEDDGDEEAPADEEEGEGKLSRIEYLNRMARGELASGSDTSDESDDSDEDVEMEDNVDSEKEDIPLGDETKRFAVMNCDWTRIRAVDLFALCQSFAPATGAVKSVTVYPSDFGLEKMKEEEQHGPRDLWTDKPPKITAAATTVPSDTDTASDGVDTPEKEAQVDSGESDDGNNDDESNGEEDEYDSDDPLGVKKSVTETESDGFDAEKLRKYELQKLKYYYAIVSCDSVKTAAAIYENCDQLEYETSSNLLDLRFVPDEMEFTNTPKEMCTGVPETYKPSIFATAALQQTDVKLTWEVDDDQRVEFLTRHSDWKNAHDDDFSAYLASENSSSDEEDDDDDDLSGSGGHGEDEAAATSSANRSKALASKKKAAKLKKIKNRYRKMLLGSDEEDDGGSESESDETGDAKSNSSESEDSGAEVATHAVLDSGGEGDAEGEEGNMEMSFTPGASDILRTKRQKEIEANETPFERYIREKKLEKNKKRHEKRTLQKQRQLEQREVLKKKGKAAPDQLKALREAIDGDDEENIVNDADADDGDRNFDMKKIALNEKVKKLKGKRKAKEMKKLDKKAGLQESFAFDAADPRFGALYDKGSQFQLDPTDPKFKKTEATQAIFQERRQRQSKSSKQATVKRQQQAPESHAVDGKSELKAIVESLKRKAQPKKTTSKTSKKARN